VALHKAGPGELSRGLGSRAQQLGQLRRWIGHGLGCGRGRRAKGTLAMASRRGMNGTGEGSARSDDHPRAGTRASDRGPVPDPLRDTAAMARSCASSGLSPRPSLPDGRSPGVVGPCDPGARPLASSQVSPSATVSLGQGRKTRKPQGRRSARPGSIGVAVAGARHEPTAVQPTGLDGRSPQEVLA